MLCDICTPIIRKPDLLRVHKLLTAPATKSCFYSPSKLSELRLIQRNPSSLPLTTNRFVEFDAAKDQWWLDYLKDSHVDPNMRDRDAITNLCLLCYAEHTSIIAYPSKDAEIKCLAPNCQSGVTVDLAASVIMKTHYNANELIKAKADT